jgi:hypothetical protein
VLRAINPHTLGEAGVAITWIGLSKLGDDPKPAALSSVTDPKMRGTLNDLLDLTIGQLRNSVSHHRAYRPLKAEAERCLEAEVNLLYRARHVLRVREFGELSAMSIGQRGMVVAAKALAITGIDLFTNLQLVADAKADFRKQMQGKTYKSAISEGQKPPLDYRDK